MNPTMKLRWVKRKIKVDPAFNVYNGHPTEQVLQQWWEDKRLIEIDGAHRYAITGEWRDIPIEEQS